MSKIKDEKDAKKRFGFESSFGGSIDIDMNENEEEIEGLTPLELINNIEDQNTRKILLDIQARVAEQARIMENARAQGLEIRRGRPKKENGTETRATFIVNEAKLEKLKEISYRDRLFLKEVVDAALTAYLDEYERIHGEIKTIKRL